MLDAQHVGDAVGAQAVLGSDRYNEQLAATDLDGPLTQVYEDGLIERDEEIIGAVVGVPDVLALDADDLNVVAVEGRDGVGRPGRDESLRGIEHVHLVEHAP